VRRAQSPRQAPCTAHQSLWFVRPVLLRPGFRARYLESPHLYEFYGRPSISPDCNAPLRNYVLRSILSRDAFHATSTLSSNLRLYFHPIRVDFVSIWSPRAPKGFGNKLLSEPYRRACAFRIVSRRRSRGGFREIFTDEKANAEFSEYVADRIRQRVKDPAIAEKLIPRDHGFGVQRVPMETRYFEVYNRDNVHLVDISETPIEEVTETGLRTSERDYDFDIIVYATGFDAITGAFDQIDIQGAGAATLCDKWSDGPSTFLGMLVHGFPNLLMPSGPQSGSASTNYPRGIETGVSWCTKLLEYMWAHGYTRAEATLEAQERWTAHVKKMYSTMLMRKAKSWFTGYNSNIPGHEHGKTRYFVYNGGSPKYVSKINEVAERDYEGIVFMPGSLLDRRGDRGTESAGEKISE
jgi:hypothetical protein